MSYWYLEFSAMWLSVLGVDFVFASGSLFIAKFALPYEQSMAGALFTMFFLKTRMTTSMPMGSPVFNGVTLARPPGADMIVSYHAANWTSVAFCLIGMPS